MEPSIVRCYQKYLQRSFPNSCSHNNGLRINPDFKLVTMSGLPLHHSPSGPYAGVVELGINLNNNLLNVLGLIILSVQILIISLRIPSTKLELGRRQSFESVSVLKNVGSVFWCFITM